MARKLRTKGSVTVSTTPILLCAANPARIGLIVQETGGTNDFRFMDDSENVATTVGVWVPAGATIILDRDICPTGDIYAVREAAGDATATATEIEG